MKAFTSYPSERRTEARAVYDVAIECGLDTFLDVETIVGGQEWPRTIAQAQEEADLTLLIFSPETATKTGVIQEEIREALRLARRRPLGDIYIVVLRTEDYALPQELRNLHVIDLFRPDWRRRLARSFQLKAVQLGLDVSDELTRYLNSVGDAAFAPATLRFTQQDTDLAANYFRYTFPGRYWDFVNAEIVAEVHRDFYRHRNYTRTGDLRMEWSFNVEEFFRDDDLISVRFSYYSDSGGVHPNHGQLSKNFGGEELGLFEITELLSTDDDTLNFLTDYCERDLARQYREEAVADGSPSTDESPLNLRSYVERHYWPFFDTFNVNRDGLVIVFSPRAYLPHAFGHHEVTIPWSELRGRINEEFFTSSAARRLGLAPEAVAPAA